ncbi:MAG: hypothetical protein WDN03_14240 [Rhizomicrobium sp.]
MARILSLLIAAVLLCSCDPWGLKNMSEAQLKSTQTMVLCSDIYAHGPKLDAERRSRGLSDCTLPDQQCVQAGYRSGTQAYNDCRYGTPQQQTYRQCYAAMLAQPTRTGSLAEAMSNAELVCSGRVPYAATRPPPLQVTNCQPNGMGGFSCTTQ